jgi:hypothetical protein
VMAESRNSGVRTRCLLLSNVPVITHTTSESLPGNKLSTRITVETNTEITTNAYCWIECSVFGSREVIKGAEIQNSRGTRHRKYNWLKHGDGQAYDRSRD